MKRPPMPKIGGAPLSLLRIKALCIPRTEGCSIAVEKFLIITPDGFNSYSGLKGVARRGEGRRSRPPRNTLSPGGAAA